MDRPAFTAKTVARFWSKVDRSAGQDGCWPYTGSVNDRGYGIFFVGEGDGPSNWIASRFAFTLAKGALGTDLACHHCDNPPCCYPLHLFAGTQKANIADMYGKGRQSLPPTMIGQDNLAAKFTERHVLEMRAAYVAGTPLKQLCGDFSASRATVQRIVSGQAWSHLPGAVPGGNRRERVREAHKALISAFHGGLSPKEAGASVGLSHVAALHVLKRAGIDLHARRAA